MSATSSVRCLSCGTDLAHDATRCPDCGAWAPDAAHGSLFTAEDLAEVETGAKPETTLPRTPRDWEMGRQGDGERITNEKPASPRLPFSPSHRLPVSPSPHRSRSPIVVASDSGTESTLIVPTQRRHRQPEFSLDETQPISRIRAQQSAARRARYTPLVVGILLGMVIAVVATLVALSVLRPVETTHLPPPRTSPPPVHVIAPPPDIEPAPVDQPAPVITELRTDTPPRVAVNPRRVSPAPAKQVEPPRTVPVIENTVRAGDLVSIDEPGVVPPQLVADVEPRLPARARLSGATGSVELSLLVDHTGRVADVRVAESSGNLQLDRSAIDAAKGSRFQPATKNGVPVRIWITRHYNFR